MDPLLDIQSLCLKDGSARLSDDLTVRDPGPRPDSMAKYSSLSLKLHYLAMLRTNFRNRSMCVGSGNDKVSRARRRIKLLGLEVGE